jgi:hypothetical protein
MTRMRILSPFITMSIDCSGGKAVNKQKALLGGDGNCSLRMAICCLYRHMEGLKCTLWSIIRCYTGACDGPCMV